LHLSFFLAFFKDFIILFSAHSKCFGNWLPYFATENPLRSMHFIRLSKFTVAAFSLAAIFVSCASPEREKPSRPNILLAISDDQSFAHTSMAGARFIETPAFDRIASEGIFFTNCYAGSPGCAPSRSTLVTGRYHWQNEQAGQHGSHWPSKYIPLPDVLAANGYAVGRTAKGVGPFRYGAPHRKTNAGGPAFNEHRYTADQTGTPPTNAINDIDYAANFKAFLEQKPEGKPFFFWYGCTEPHRAFEEGSWKRTDKTLEIAEVPAFLPDNETVRGDLLDYAVEIEWFDHHLQLMLEHLEAIGELENTIIIVTSDNGMAFPRAKANGYEYGVHVPLAIRLPKQFPGGRTVEDPMSFVDFAPTILELTGTPDTAMLPMSGKSFAPMLLSDETGETSFARDFVLSGRERHSSSRHQNLGYPQRIMRKGRYLLIWNMKPERWPAGAPQRLKPDSIGGTYPMYGLDSTGQHISEWAFTDIDACPTKSWIVENHETEAGSQFFEMAVAKRPEYELFDVVADPYCLQNLAGDPEFAGMLRNMQQIMKKELKATQDPRLVGPNPGIFDTYPRYMKIRDFPTPDWMAESP